MQKIIILVLLTTTVVIVAYIMFKRQKKIEIRDRVVCIGNLIRIEAAKDQYSLKYGKTNGWCWRSDEAAFRDLIESGEFLKKRYFKCPKLKGVWCLSNTVASYSVNAIGESPACKFHLHSKGGLDQGNQEGNQGRVSTFDK